MIKKVLIANRGEIALRIIRTLKDMGIESVAVYSDVDRNSRHVRIADEAYHIGGSLSSESYLRMDKIIDVAKKSGADAIHPGYGFLSENDLFAKACEDEGIIFIGPSSPAIHAMGEKTRARKLMAKAGVPVVPGTLDPLKDSKEALQKAEEIGFPVMLKAAAGGGGKGMRLVLSGAETEQAFLSASSEALSAFGDGGVYMEKAIIKPRHIEMQILMDKSGRGVWLGERECSMQRRHQKVVEEAPSPFVNEEMRRKMGEVAVKAARAVGYSNAGTIEFLVDQEKNFYFMEMNTRLQVEHPVTEAVTGLDLVWEQIKIAEGRELSIRQSDMSLRGWAVECRVYAEDPSRNFMPSPGTVSTVRIPEGPRVRVDSAVYAGGEVTSYYDPLIAKVIAWGRDRRMAVSTMKRALREFVILGLETNKYFLEKLISHQSFLNGEYDTSFIAEFLENEFREPDDSLAANIGACIYAYETAKKRPHDCPSPANVKSSWKTMMWKS